MESCDVIFYGWLPNIMFSRFIYIVASINKYFIPFYDQIIFIPLYGYATLNYPLISWWTFELFYWDILATINNAVEHPCVFVLWAVLGLHCCEGFSLVAASRGYSAVAVQSSRFAGFTCCRAQARGCVDSGVAAHGLSCSVTFGTFLD